MKLMANEKMIMETDGKILVLTSHRVRYNAASMSNADFMSIMLEEVASCGIVKKSKPFLLIIAIILVLLGLYMGQNNSKEVAIGCIIIAVIFGIAYFSTIRKLLEIGSAGSSILVNVSKMGMNQIIEFVDELEVAKNLRRKIDTISQGPIIPPSKSSPPSQEGDFASSSDNLPVDQINLSESDIIGYTTQEINQINEIFRAGIPKDHNVVMHLGSRIIKSVHSSEVENLLRNRKGWIVIEQPVS